MKWKILKKPDKRTRKALSDYPRIIQQILFNRGIKTKKKAKEFLDPKYAPFYDPLTLFDVKCAAKYILKAIEEKKKIVIHGDYDVDGICSTTILWDFLYRNLGADALPYVPSRFDEGYGMSDASITAIKKMGGEVIITVDCGIRDDELIEKWSKKGLEFIITDHHELDEENGKLLLPKKALAVVHPKHPKGKYPQKDLSGTAVVWKLIHALTSFSKIKIDPDNYLDLVATSTVCDVMPLTGENRSIVKVGLEKIRNTERVGLRRLVNDAGISPEEIETYHLGFIIGPRLNAAGRLDHALDAIRLLATRSYAKAREISSSLNTLNTKRQQIQEDIYQSALKQIQEIGVEKKLFFAWGEDWAEGVIGIVAGKLSENFQRPVLIATRKGDGYTGSARSTSRFNIIEAIHAQSELLERYGGHPQAAGFTVSAESIELFRDNLLELADRDLGEDDIEKETEVDCVITKEEISWDLHSWLERLSPFGFGNPKPEFVLRNVELHNVSFVGKDKTHLRFSIMSEKTGEYFSAIGFNLREQFQEIARTDNVDILFNLEENEWNGNTNLQLNVKDIRAHNA